jgi:hypothetical protein
MQWKYPNSPPTKKFNVTPSAGNVMLTVFCNSQGVLFAIFRSVVKMWILHRTVKFCWRFETQITENGQARDVLLHHDNARPHTARKTQERIQGLQRELLEYPPYNSYLDSSDFHLSGPLKTALVAKVSLMTKWLKRKCESSWDNSQKASMLRVSAHGKSMRQVH